MCSDRCYPIQHSKIELKDEPTFKQDKCTVCQKDLMIVCIFHRVVTCLACNVQVSWHADSTLEHFSTIGVYHVTSSAEDPCTALPAQSSSSPEDAASVDSSWHIAMRVHYDAEGPNLGKPSSRAAEMKSSDTDRQPVPPVLFALPSKSAYFLLDDFNHHHQHSGQLVLRFVSCHVMFGHGDFSFTNVCVPQF